MKIIAFTQKKQDKHQRIIVAKDESAVINKGMGVPAVLYRRREDAFLIPLTEIAEIEVAPASIDTTQGGSTVAF